MSDALDMSLFFGTPEQQVEFCTALLDTLKTRGVAKLKNHGIPQETIHSLFDWARKFFSLSYEEKMVAKHPPKANPNRGYSYVGQENTATLSGYEKGLGPGKTRDIKESFDMGADNDELVSNLWIEEESLPGFRKFMENFYKEAFKTELNILSALARALGIPETHLTSLHSRAENEFRLLHYPTVPLAEFKNGTATRIAEHTDFGTITMLFQDSTGGLQVEDQTELGTFRNVEASSPTDIILNIGDSLQRLTNDTFRAACHRVTFPPTIKGDNDDELLPERYSVAYFAKPNYNDSLLPLKEFITETTPCRYKEDITAWEWNNLRIKNLYG
ncbi:hypothetical protein VF21_04796 [Pseudogymnoascus sp. 05NY08]|nr:hypothetical protein VF21_04796 [Pseudogymnoascus sp. 05NY08]